MSVSTLSETRVQDRILTATRDKVLPGLVDQSFTHSPLAAFLFGRTPGDLGASRGERRMGPRTVGSGTTIEQRVNLGKNKTAKRSTSHWSTVDNTPSDTRRIARENYRFYDAAVNVSDHELRVNRGAERVVPLVEAEMRLGVDSLLDLVMDDFLSAATIANGMNSVVALANDTTTVHGIAPGTYGDWAARGLDGRTVATGGRDFTSGAFSTQGLADMRLLINNATEGSVQVDALFTDWTSFGYLEGELEAQERFQDSDLAKAGFVNLTMKGKPVLADGKIDENLSGYMLALNFDHLYMMALSGSMFDMEEFHPSERQKASTAKIHFTGNSMVDRRWASNYMSGITA